MSTVDHWIIFTISEALAPVPAKDIVELPRGIQFRLPIGKTKGMNQARIVQDQHGTFTLTFERIKRNRAKGVESKPYGEIKGVHLADLKSTFFEATGLPTA